MWRSLSPIWFSRRAGHISTLCFSNKDCLTISLIFIYYQHFNRRACRWESRQTQLQRNYALLHFPVEALRLKFQCHTVWKESQPHLTVTDRITRRRFTSSFPELTQWDAVLLQISCFRIHPFALVQQNSSSSSKLLVAEGKTVSALLKVAPKSLRLKVNFCSDRQQI